MAVNIFEKYGIKEVANVYFEALADDPSNNIQKGDIVLYLDTLKVSSIETTAENAAAQGGWGNPKLVMWDYGKEINLTLEDALISLESLRFMMGGAIKRAKSTDKVIVNLTEQAEVTTENKIPELYDHLTGEKFAAPTECRWINLTQGTRGRYKLNSEKEEEKFTAAIDDLVRIFWSVEVEQEDAAVEVTISPNTFPGTYKVVGDTFMRSEKTGKDEAFQFVIGKAKVLSEVTITLEAEGDPSTFEMQLNVLRSTNERGENEMMKLIRYNAADLA
jgi:hypothetical protein